MIGYEYLKFYLAHGGTKSSWNTASSVSIYSREARCSLSVHSALLNSPWTLPETLPARSATGIVTSAACAFGLTAKTLKLQIMADMANGDGLPVEKWCAIAVNMLSTLVSSASYMIHVAEHGPSLNLVKVLWRLCVLNVTSHSSLFVIDLYVLGDVLFPTLYILWGEDAESARTRTTIRGKPDPSRYLNPHEVRFSNRNPVGACSPAWWIQSAICHLAASDHVRWVE